MHAQNLRGRDFTIRPSEGREKSLAQHMDEVRRIGVRSRMTEEQNGSPGGPVMADMDQRIEAIAQTGLTFTGITTIMSGTRNCWRCRGDDGRRSGMPDSQKVLDLFRGESGYATRDRGSWRCGARRRFCCARARGWGLDTAWGLGGRGRIAQRHGGAGSEKESGYDVKPRWLAAIFDRNKHPHPPQATHAYKLFFLCDLVGGVATPTFETPEVAFFRRDALPKLSAPRITEFQIVHMFEHAAHPERPTTFD